MFKLDNLKYSPGAKKRKKRVGRGSSAGQGKTCGRGHKGQKSRTGGGTRPGFEGGQNPLYRRLPKQRGFDNSYFKKAYRPVNISALLAFDGKVTPGDLIANNLLQEGERVKILSCGEIAKSLVVEAHAFSKKASEKIEKAGGKAVVCQA